MTMVASALNLLTRARIDADMFGRRSSNDINSRETTSLGAEVCRRQIVLSNTILQFLKQLALFEDLGLIKNE